MPEDTARIPDAALCPHVSVGVTEGWGSPTFPRCVVDKRPPLLPLLTHRGSHPAPLPITHSFSLRGQTPEAPRPSSSWKKIRTRNPHEADGKPQMSLLPGKRAPHRREGPRILPQCCHCFLSPALHRQDQGSNSKALAHSQAPGSAHQQPDGGLWGVQSAGPEPGASPLGIPACPAPALGSPQATSSVRLETQENAAPTWNSYHRHLGASI